jgi:tetratricopeptide (TPR) repeat protein
MVIDNADDIETLFPSRASEQGEPVNGSASLATYLPQSRNGCILFTSRNRDVAARLAGGYHNIQEVLPMNERQAMDLLRNKLPDGLYEEGPAAELVRTLDYIPLAITQAAAYIGRRTRMTINRYLDEFLENSNARQSLLHQDAGDLRRDGTASNSMVITWQMSFERIHQERSSAAELLSLMSFFNPQGIPEKLLRKYHQWYHRDARRVVEADSDLDAEGLFNEDLDILYAFSLVTPVMGTGISSNATLEMHGLVQFCTRIWLSSKGHEGQWQGAFVELLAQEFPTGQYENWRLCEQLIPHVESVRKTEPMSTELLRAWAHLLTRSGWYLCNRGDYELAEKTTRKALDVQERTFGLSDGNTRESASVLAMILRYQGKTEEAEMLTRRLLDWHEKGTTSDSVSQDPDALSLTAMANQADSLCAQQKYNEAEKLSRHVLDKRCKKLGPNHQDTLMSMYNLAGVFLSQSKHLEASDLAHHVLTMREQDLGPTHPDTLMATSMLATILSRLDQPAKVESLNRHALTGFEKELGPRHPYTLTALANLAWTLRNQAKLAEATEMNRRALDGREKVLGLGHLDTLASVYSLANGLHLLGKLEEAEPLYLRAYDGLVRELGEGHESVAACGRDLEALRGEARVKQGGGKDGVLVREGSILKGVGDRRDSIFARIRGKMRKRG